MTTTDNIDIKNGIVKWFDKMKGYGFVQEINTDNDFFVHYSQLQSNDDSHNKHLFVGEYISFTETDYNNPRATERSVGTSTRTAGNVTGIGGGPLMYQTHLTRPSFYKNEKSTRHRVSRNVHSSSQAANRPTSSTTEPTEKSNPFSLLATE